MKNIKLFMLCVCGLWMMSLTGCSDAGGSAGMAVVGEGGNGGEGPMIPEGGTGGEGAVIPEGGTGGEGAVIPEGGTGGEGAMIPEGGTGGTGGGSVPEEPEACQAGPEQEQDDSDDDGITDACDNCPMTWNEGQQDIDGDGDGDVCDADPDGDGRRGDNDSFPHCNANDPAQRILVVEGELMDEEAFLQTDFQGVCGIDGRIEIIYEVDDAEAAAEQEQANVSALAEKLAEFSANVRNINGGLRISGTAIEGILLEELRSVGRDIGSRVTVSENAELRTLNFPLLQTVRGSVVVESNGALEGMSFPVLETVGLSVLVRNNGALEGMSFPALELVVGNMRVENSGALEGMSFPALETVGGHMVVESNGELEGISFPALETVWGDMVVESNGALEGIFFPALKTVTFDMVMTENGELEEMFFPALETVGGGMSVTENGKLDGMFFPILETVGWSVRVYGNTNLSEIRFPLLRSIGNAGLDQINDGGGLVIGQLPELTHVSFPNLHRIYSSNDGVELEVGGFLAAQHTLYIGEVPQLLLHAGVAFLDLDNIEEMPGADENISTLNRLQNPGDEGGLIFGRLGQEIDGEPGHISNHGRIYAPRNIP